MTDTSSTGCRGGMAYSPLCAAHGREVQAGLHRGRRWRCCRRTGHRVYPRYEPQKSRTSRSGKVVTVFCSPRSLRHCLLCRSD
ncbi:hypothetical protein KIF59_14465 [Enterobacter cloacae subsp. cloacae]|nr:hypothetical protein [Enterobacter cloacae subsp. cloacae]